MYIYIYLLVGPTCQTCGAGLADKRARIANFFAREELSSGFRMVPAPVPAGKKWCPYPCPSGSMPAGMRAFCARCHL